MVEYNFSVHLSTHSCCWVSCFIIKQPMWSVKKLSIHKCQAYATFYVCFQYVNNEVQTISRCDYSQLLYISCTKLKWSFYICQNINLVFLPKWIIAFETNYLTSTASNIDHGWSGLWLTEELGYASINIFHSKLKNYDIVAQCDFRLADQHNRLHTLW